MHVIKAETKLGHLQQKKIGGRYRVDLIDPDNGKVKQRHEADNYVTDAIDRFARHAQYIAAGPNHGMVADSDFSPQDPDQRASYQGSGWWAHRPAAPWPIANDSIIATNFAGAEDTTDEWGRGNVVAAATRHKVTVPAAGPRGLINEAECTISADLRTYTWVWDWTTQQGNGTYRSLHMGAMEQYPARGENMAAMACMVGATGKVLGYPATMGAVIRCLAYCVDPDNDDVYALTVDAGVQMSVWKWTAAQWVAATASDAGGDFDWVAECSLVCNVTQNILTYSTSTGSSLLYYGNQIGFCKLPSAGDFIVFCTGNNGTTHHFLRFNSSGTTVTYNTATGFTSGFGATSARCYSLAYDATAAKLYMVEWQPNLTNPTVGLQPNMGQYYRFNPTTGAYEAAITIPDNTKTYIIGPCCNMFDGNMLLHCADGLRVVAIATGTAVSPYNLGQPVRRQQGSFSSSAYMGTLYYGGQRSDCREALVAPAAGWYSIYGLQAYTGRGPKTDMLAVLGRGLNSNSQYDGRYWAQYQQNAPDVFGAAGDQLIPANETIYATLPHLLWIGDRLFIAPARGARQASASYGATLHNSGRNLPIYSVDGRNISSRALLDADVTKTNTQNMKITYELTLPANWHQPLAHANPMLNA